MSIETPRVNAQRYLTCEQPTSFLLYQLGGLKLGVWVCVDQLTKRHAALTKQGKGADFIPPLLSAPIPTQYPTAITTTVPSILLFYG